MFLQLPAGSENVQSFIFCSDENISVIYHTQIEICIKTAFQVEMAAIRHMDTIFNKHTVPTFSQQSFQQFLPFLPVFRTGMVVIKHYFFTMSAQCIQLLFLFDIYRILMSVLIKKHSICYSVF